MHKILVSAAVIFILVSGVAKSDELCVKETHFYNSGFDSAQSLSSYLDALKNDLKDSKRESIAKRILFPIFAKVDNKKITIKNVSEFLEHYSQIMNAKVQNAILSQNFCKLRRYSEGVRVGAGEIWIASVKREGRDNFETKIITINN